MALLCCATTRPLTVRCQAQQDNPRLVTFLGKGGVGKTSCAVIAAQYYASLGLRTCLVVQSQDETADFLLGQRLKHSPVSLGNGSLTAFRAETTKLLLEPLNQLKRADAQMNFTQGALQEVAGEELSVLPGMASILALVLLEQLTGFGRKASKRFSESFKPKYDVVVYDGFNSEETVRMFGSAERARWYTNRFRSIAEKTDVGRVALPSILRLTEASLDDSSTEGSTSQLWEEADSVLQGVQLCFSDPQRFSSYIVTDPSSKIAEKSALRQWGSAMQAGMHVAGFLHHTPRSQDDEWKQKYLPLPLAAVPSISFDEAPNWQALLTELSQDAKELLKATSSSSPALNSVSLDRLARTVTCFLPGFEKSEVKLSQLKDTELLLEAGDQRRVISLPSTMHGRVAGAKLQNRSLVIKLKSV